MATLILSADRAAAACSGLNTATVLCDAANPSGGSFITSFPFTSTVTVNSGAGVTGSASATVGSGDLGFFHNDPAGIGSIGLSNAGTGATSYVGTANVANGINAFTAGGALSILQNAGVISNGITLFGQISDVTIKTGQLDGFGIMINAFGTQASLDITTGAINAPALAIQAQLGSGAGNSLKVRTTGAVTGPIDLRNQGNGATSYTADAVVNGPVFVQAGVFNNAGTTTVTLNDRVTGPVQVFGNGRSNVTTRDVDGTLGVLGRLAGSSLSVTGNVTSNVGPSAFNSNTGALGVNFINSGTVDINGSVSATSDQTGTGQGALVTGANTSVGLGSVLLRGPVSATMIHDATQQGDAIGLQSFMFNGTVTADGAVSATSTAGTANATAVVATGSSNTTATTLNGAVTATATSSNPNASTAIGVSVGPGTNLSGSRHTLTTNGAVTATAVGAGGTATGIHYAVAGGPSAGLLDIVANGAVTATSDGAAAGISVDRSVAFRNTSITTKATVTATSASAAALGVNYSGPNTLAVALRTEGDVIATGLAGTFGIKAASTGAGDMTIDVLGKVQSSHTGIGISRTGTGNQTLTTGANANIIGVTGVTTTGGTTAIVHGGKITGSGGTAIQFGGTNDTLTLLPGYGGITGNVLANASSALQLGGTSAAVFDVTKLNAGAQFGTFTTLNLLAGSNWTFGGDSTYGGTVNVGTFLTLANTMANANFVVGSGGTLGGNGTAGNTTINAGGALAPGNSIGAITINGNLVFGAGAIYKVEIDGPASDKTTVTGTAKLDGQVLVTPVNRLTRKTSYTILSAASLSGTFGSAAVSSSNNFARNPVLSYAGGDVVLTLDPGLISPLLVTPSRNQKAVAGAIDTAITGGATLPTSFDALFALTVAQLPGALDLLSGEIHASTASALADESLHLRSAVLGRLRQASYGGDAGMASLATGGPQTAFMDDAIEGALAYAKSPVVAKAPMRAPAASSDVVFWAQGFGSWGRIDGDGNAATVRRDLVGFVTGVDTRIGANGRAGVAAGYTGSKNAADGRATASVETAHAAAYGGWSFGAVNVRGGAALAVHSIDTDRTIAFPGFFDRATARRDGHTGQVFGEIGYGFAFGNVAIEPFAGGAWVRTNLDAAAERALAAGLNIGANAFEVGYTTLGVRAAGMILLGSDMMLVPRGSLAWQHAYGDLTPAAALAFQFAPTAFSVSGVPIARDSLLAEAGLDLAIGRNVTIGASYTGQIGDRVQDHGAKAKFVYRF